MIESEHMPTPMDDIHEVYPPEMDQKAVEVYNLLRKANPWLPDPSKVMASSDMELSWGPRSLTTLRLTVAIDLPVGIKFEDWS